jgi:hypothetical protein
MTRRQGNITVEARADLVLADEPSAKAYAAYFEAQLRSGKIRRLLYTSYQWFLGMGTQNFLDRSFLGYG